MAFSHLSKDIMMIELCVYLMHYMIKVQVNNLIIYIIYGNFRVPIRA